MSGLFSKERIDSVRQFTKDVKERKAKFSGKALQSIGVIPKNGEVTLKLDPDSKIIRIQYSKDINIQLPYDRVLGFRLEAIDEEADNTKTELAGLVLSSGLLGGTIVGKAGKLATEMIGKNRKRIVWVGTLIYKNKEGEIQELSFVGEEEELYGNDKPCKNSKDEEFERIINKIAMNHNPNIMEL